MRGRAEGTHMRTTLPMVWSSPSMVNVAAFCTFVSATTSTFFFPSGTFSRSYSCGAFMTAE